MKFIYLLFIYGNDFQYIYNGELYRKLIIINFNAIIFL